MSIIEFLEAALGTSDNYILYSISAFFVMYILIDMFHVFYTAVFSWFNKK